MSSEAPAVKGIGRWFTVLEGVRPYQRKWLSKDIVAGITLAALAIPETMGYTKIAGMPVITGLYTILIPILAFAVFGSSRHLVVGADSATAAIMYAGIAALGISGATPDSPQWVGLAGLSALIAGGLMFIARIARFGFLANFLSRTVLIGFLTGVGVQVAIGQVGGMFDVPDQNVSSTVFAGTIRKFALTVVHIGEGSWQTALVSAAVLAILLVFGRWIKAVPGGLVAVVGMIILSDVFDFASHNISTLGPVPSGLPHIGLPQHVAWNDVGLLMATSTAMFLVILAQSAATSRAYAVKYNESFEENTDLVGLGFANIAAGLSSTFVVNGSPTKTEMADDAKSHTQVAQITTAAVVAIVLLFLTKPLQYLPNCVLSSVVFLIGLKLIDIHGMKQVYRLNREEFWVAALTALVVVAVGVEQGIILALLLSLVLHVRRHYSTVDVVITRDAKGHVAPIPWAPDARTAPGLVIYRFGAGIFYANSTRLSEEILALATSDDPPHWVVLDCAAIDDIDYTGGKTLAELAGQLRERNIMLALCNLEERVQIEVDRYGITAKIGSAHIYETVEDAIDAFRAAGSSG